ncbi:MAG: hypothetical protein GX684_00195 [Ruminococcaceae bacterium]|nr:hypothetical protein [Oscillospiraceae bacterium]
MKKLISALSLIIIIIVGIVSVKNMYETVPVTYDGSKTDVYALMQDPQNYDTSDADGAASVIVKQNLAKTQAVNNVTSIVFDFRGYDTMGEAFILVIAITGTAAILRKPKQRWEGD